MAFFKYPTIYQRRSQREAKVKQWTRQLYLLSFTFFIKSAEFKCRYDIEVTRYLSFQIFLRETVWKGIPKVEPLVMFNFVSLRRRDAFIGLAFAIVWLGKDCKAVGLSRCRLNAFVNSNTTEEGHKVQTILYKQWCGYGGVEGCGPHQGDSSVKNNEILLLKESIGTQLTAMYI